MRWSSCFGQLALVRPLVNQLQGRPLLDLTHRVITQKQREEIMLKTIAIVATAVAVLAASGLAQASRPAVAGATAVSKSAPAPHFVLTKAHKGKKKHKKAA
jgi:hypothetical protein